MLPRAMPFVPGAVLLSALGSATAEAGEPPKQKLQICIMVGQSNMVDMGDIGPEATKGTLTHFTKKEGKYP